MGERGGAYKCRYCLNRLSREVVVRCAGGRDGRAQAGQPGAPHGHPHRAQGGAPGRRQGVLLSPCSALNRELTAWMLVWGAGGQTAMHWVDKRTHLLATACFTGCPLLVRQFDLAR